MSAILDQRLTYTLKTFGSYTAGGRIAHVTEGEPVRVQFTRQASMDVDPRGHFAIEHAYVQYFVPANRNAQPPVLLVHGGGMSGSCWESTLDKRRGWLQQLLLRGYEVHVVDAMERGRAGFAPGHWEGEPFLRSMEEAWLLFRIGSAENFFNRIPFDKQRFPVDQLEGFARSFVPRWTSTTSLQVSALIAVLQRTGPSIVICHSQGGEIVFDAHNSNPELFAEIVALEPSNFPARAEVLSGTPTRILAGDYLDINPQWIERHSEWIKLCSEPGVELIGSDQLGRGNSHMLMLDNNSEIVLDYALQR